MKTILIVSLVFLGCSTSQNFKSNFEKALDIQKYFTAKESKNEIIQSLGINYQINENGIVYYTTDSRIPELGLFFSQENILETAFIFLTKEELLNFKSTIPCNWNEKDEIEDFGHYFRSVKKGNCIELQISYQSRKSISNLIEVRWQRR